MAMAIPAIMQVASNPQVQKSTKKILKYGLIFGGLGAAVLAFVFLSKKFKFKNPLKSLFGGGGFIGKIGQAIMGAGGKWAGDVGKAGGKWAGDVGKAGGKWAGDVQKSFTKIPSKWKVNQRRLFRRASSGMSRSLGSLGKLNIKGFSGRSNIMKSVFRKVKKSKSRNISRTFTSAFKRRSRSKKKKRKKGWL